MKLTDEQKTIIKVLKHYYDISPSNEQVIIPHRDLTRYVDAHRVDLILKKFAKDYAIISNVSNDMNRDNTYIESTLIFTNKFEDFYDKYVTKEEEREEQERREWQEEQDRYNYGYVDPAEEYDIPDYINNGHSKIYWLDYSEKSRKLILNDRLVITKTNSNSNPDNFLSYIFQNQNREISITEIQDKGKVEIKRDFHKILDDLYFRGAVKKLFFTVSKTTITFHNPVSKKQMQEVGVELLQLSDFIRNNPKD